MKPLNRALAAITLAALPAGMAIWLLCSTASPDPAAHAGETSRSAFQRMNRGPASHRQIALTFDADSGVEGIGELLETLHESGVPATFFLTGKWADQHPEWAASIASHGHTIGNHSWGHKDLQSMEDWEIKEEILRTDDRFSMGFGNQYQRIFRLPCETHQERVSLILNSLGFRLVGWSIDSLDAAPPRKSAAFITDRITRHSDEELSGAIILFNVGFPETTAALPAIVHTLGNRGFEFVPLDHWLPR